MKKLLIIFSVFFALLLREECHGQSGSVRYTAGINYTVGVPTFVPQGNVSRVAIDTGTMKWYEYAQVGGWRWSGDRVQDISGCSAPAYVPGKAQSRLVLNACTEAQNGHGPELYKYTGSAWLCLNCGGNYTAGDGIDITGTEITNTGDLSATNELQTLSVSNDTLSISDGNSVALPGGGVTWPLLAPTAEIPVSYSFEDYPQTGMFSPDGGLYLNTLNGDGFSNIIAIYAGAGTLDPGGPVEMAAGGSAENDGGYFLINAGSSNSGNGGGFDLKAGDSETASGGNYNIRSGNGVTGGNFSMAAGNGVAGGSFTMNAGSGTESPGGRFVMYAGASLDATGGDFEMYAGGSDNNTGGNVVIGAGFGATAGGTTTIQSGYSSEAGTPGNVVIECGTQLGAEEPKMGKMIMSNGEGFRPSVVSVSQRDIFDAPEAGDTIFCYDCTANDSSTGVLQTYNGSTWKNHW